MEAKLLKVRTPMPNSKFKAGSQEAESCPQFTIHVV